MKRIQFSVLFCIIFIFSVYCVLTNTVSKYK
uniref:Uncharacterized protein n=1 Tax=Rhizophora mucronata TaxID=61149 RepID=A0A2P2QNZ9_RHIMU